MQSVSSFIDLSRIGIESAKKERCPECDYGMRITVVVDDVEQSRCRYCEDKKLAKELNFPQTKQESERRRLLNRANHFTRLPEDLTGAMLNDYIAETPEQQKAKRLAIDFITNFNGKQSLVFSGDPGVGKTHIAVAIHNAIAKEHTTLFLKSTQLLDLIKASYNGVGYSEMDVLDTCADVDLLVLDDLGAEYAKEGDSESWASDILFKVIDSRLGKSLIVTTNYSESLLEQKYGYNGKRITSRLSDDAEKIRIVGKDRRRND